MNGTKMAVDGAGGAVHLWMMWPGPSSGKQAGQDLAALQATLDFPPLDQGAWDESKP